MSVRRGAPRTAANDQAARPGGAAEILTRDTVAVLGAAGPVGFPVARNLARAGITVRAWDRFCSTAEPLAEAGVFVAGSPAEAAKGAGIVVTLLPSVGAVLSVMADEVLGVMRETGDEEHAIWLQLGIIGPDATKRCAELAGRYGVGFVDAPVHGGEEAAERGELVAYESGPEEARPRIQPLFDVIGCRTIRVGEAGAGTAVSTGAATPRRWS
jgi:3-hydroxyisobutyrate dehydrogenase